MIRCDAAHRCTATSIRGATLSRVPIHESLRIQGETSGIDFGQQEGEGIENRGELHIDHSRVIAHTVLNGRADGQMTREPAPRSTITDSSLDLGGGLEITSGAVTLTRSAVLGNVDVRGQPGDLGMQGLPGRIDLSASNFVYGTLRVGDGAFAALKYSTVDQRDPSLPAVLMERGGTLHVEHNARVDAIGPAFVINAGNAGRSELIVSHSDVRSARSSVFRVNTGGKNAKVLIGVGSDAPLIAGNEVLLDVDDRVKSHVALTADHAELVGHVKAGIGSKTHVSLTNHSNLNGIMTRVRRLSLIKSGWILYGDSDVAAIVSDGGRIDVSRARLKTASLSGSGSIEWSVATPNAAPPVQVSGDMSGDWTLTAWDSNLGFAEGELRDQYTIVSVSGVNTARVDGRADIGAYRYSNGVDAQGNVMATREVLDEMTSTQAAHDIRGEDDQRAPDARRRSHARRALRASETQPASVPSDDHPVTNEGIALSDDVKAPHGPGGVGEVADIATLASIADSASSTTSSTTTGSSEAPPLRAAGTAGAPTTVGRPALNAGASAAVDALSMASARAIWDAQFTSLRLRQQALRDFAPDAGSFWAQTYQGNASLSNGYAPRERHVFDMQVTGVAVGGDRIVRQMANAQLISGLYGSAVGASRTTAHSRGATRGFSLGLYSTWIHTSGWYLDAMLAYGQLHQSFTAQLLGAHARSSVAVRRWRADSGVIVGEVGRRIPLRGGLILQPAVGVRRVQQSRTSTLTDTGHALSSDPIGTTGLNVSLTVTKAFNHGNTEFRPYARFGYSRERQATQRIRYAGSLIETGVGTSRAMLNAGLAMQVAKTHAVFVDAQYQSGRDEASNYLANLGYRYTF